MLVTNGYVLSHSPTETEENGNKEQEEQKVTRPR
jgi:hypothetical protein